MSSSAPEFYEKKTSTILRNLESIWNKLLHSPLVLSADLSAENLQDFEDTMNSGTYSSDDYQLVGNFVRNLCRPNKNEFIEYICKIKMQYLSLLTNGSMIPRLIWFVDKETKKRRPLQDILAVDYDHERGKFIVRLDVLRSNITSNLDDIHDSRGNNRKESYESRRGLSNEVKPANNRERKMERREQRETNNRERNHDYRNETNDVSPRDNDDNGYIKVGRNNRPVASNLKYRERQDKRGDNRSENRSDYRAKSYNPQNPDNDPRWKYNKNKLRNEQRALIGNPPRDFKRGEKNAFSTPREDKPETIKQKIEPISNNMAEIIIKELSNNLPSEKETNVSKSDAMDSNKTISEEIKSPIGKNWADYE